jgi:metal-responsive CopG/Arc/MetJ family transcriptional regulator
MAAIQVVIDKELLRAADRAAKRAHVNRSALIRKALREHLKQLRIRELDLQERRAYEKRPDSPRAWSVWEREIVWPEY